MSNLHLTAALNTPCQTHTQKLVLLVLCDHADEKTGKCFPGLSRLQSQCDLSRQAVITQIKALEKNGLISIVRAPHVVNTYRIDVFLENNDPKKPRIRPNQSTPLTGQREAPPQECSA